MNHFETALPYVTLTVALLWSFVHHKLTEPVIRFVLPKDAYETLVKRRIEDEDLDRMTLVNATALIHACVVVPVALYCVFFDPIIQKDPINGQSTIFQVMLSIMCGYFLWDTLSCMKNLRLYGYTFLLHGIVSFVGTYGHTAANRGQTPWYVSIFMVTELSTPFLHVRWFLTKAGQTNTTYFRIANLVFLATFVGYRLILVEVVGLFPYLYTIFYGEARHYMGMTRKVETAVVLVLWMFLNYFWGFSLLMSQLKHLKKPKRE